MTQNHRLPPKEWRKEPGLLLTSKSQRAACLARDNGICCDCRESGKPWHAEHDVALHAIPPSIGFPSALKYWQITNLKTRCVACHALKSKSEATSRAKVKRLIRKANGIESKWKQKMAQRQFKPIPKKLPWKRKNSTPSRHKPVISYLLYKRSSPMG